VRRLSIVVMMGIGVGCGDKSPQEECEELVSSICDRAEDCLPGVPVEHDECTQDLRNLARCERVEVHSTSYEACMNRVEAISCQALFTEATTTRFTATLPQECNTVVDLPPTSLDGLASPRLTTSVEVQ
jgi:hypothetical protein